jgi:N-acetyl-alpha-D-muramate 1-phosphate uridylyltransferase
MVHGIDSAMILAAGTGSRLRPLTDDTPKPLINVGAQPVILRTLHALAQAGVKRVVINTHYFATMVQQTVRAHTPAGVTVFFSEEAHLLETGGGLKKALSLLGDKPFLVVNSDAVWLEKEAPLLEPLMRAFDIKKHDALLAVVPAVRVKEFMPFGDFVFDKRSKKLTRKNEREKWNVVYAGVHVTHPSFIALEPQEVFSLNRIWDSAREEGRLHGYFYDAPWTDMGTHTGLYRAREMVSALKG